MAGAKSESNYGKIQRLFKMFQIDYEEYSRFVLKLFTGQSKYYLVMDRTNWKFGNSDINILMLGIIYKNNCFPLFWEMLNKGGSSNTQERKALLKKSYNTSWKRQNTGYIRRPGVYRGSLFRYLLSEGIEFHIRLPKQIKGGSTLQKHRRTIEYLFRNCKENTKIDYPKPVNILGFKLYVSGMKSSKGFCMVVSSRTNLDSLKKNQLRWTIENMFGSFKKRGFNFEDTHMTNPEKLKKLIVIISIAYTRSILVG